jgi:CheY-like chemotaxis protein
VELLTLPELRGVRVLGVDDDAVNRAILEAQLGAWGMQVDGVADGAAAFARLRASHAEGRPYARRCAAGALRPPLHLLTPV